MSCPVRGNIILRNGFNRPRGYAGLVVMPPVRIFSVWQGAFFVLLPEECCAVENTVHNFSNIIFCA